MIVRDLIKTLINYNLDAKVVMDGDNCVHEINNVVCATCDGGDDKTCDVVYLCPKNKQTRNETVQRLMPCVRHIDGNINNNVLSNIAYDVRGGIV